MTSAAEPTDPPTDDAATRRTGSLPPPKDDDVTVQRFAAALASGTLLNGKFEVIDVLGKPGGFGIAYLCQDTKLNRRVVVKELFPAGIVSRRRGAKDVVVLTAEYSADFSFQLASLLDEARKLAALEQVNAVVKVYDHFTENNTAYIVMHQVVGSSLGDRLRDLERIDARQLMRWAWPLLKGLDAVHHAGVLHRDIKPENVLIDQRDQPVLIDFGNAAAVQRDGRESQGHFAVSPYYGAPEQYTNDMSRMGPWTDLYSVGAVMYFALTGRKPLDAMKRLNGAAMAPIRNLVPELPASLADAIEACLQLEPSERPASASALLTQLATLQPIAHQWHESLPSNAFGRRMLRVHTQLQKGQVLPRQWNIAAGLLQGLWLFLHRLTLSGAVWTLAAVGVVLAIVWPQDPWPTLPFGLAVAWLLAALPCALFADLLKYKQVRQIGASLPLATEPQIAESREVLAELGRPSWRLLPLCLLFPLLIGLVGLSLNERQTRVRTAVEKAIELNGLREQFRDFVNQQGRPPSVDELPPFTANAEVKSVEFRPSGLEVVLALPELPGRRLRWLLGRGGTWSCEAVDVPVRFVPKGCSSP